MALNRKKTWEEFQAWLETQRKQQDDYKRRNPFVDYSNKTSMDNLLMGLNGRLPEGIQDNTYSALDGLMSNYGANATTERSDALFQFILQLLATSDQRLYDKEVLDEQRNYDSPVNQLARLMGSGVSRDAAIALLSGNGSNGSSLVGSGSGVSVPSVPAPSGTAENAAMATAVNSVAAIANTIVNLAMAGMQMYQAYETIEFQKSQNYMSNEQRSAYDAVNQVSQALQLLDSNDKLGENIHLSDFSSVEELHKHLSSIAGDNQDIKDLINSSAYKRAVGTIFGREFFNNNFAARRESRDSGDMARYLLKQEELRTLTMSLDQQKLSAEISKLGAETELVDAETAKTLQSIVNLQTEVKLLNKQGDKIDWETKTLKLNYDISSTGLPLLKEVRTNQLRKDALMLRALFKEERRKIPTFLQDESTGEYIVSMPNFDTYLATWLKQGSNAYDVAYLTELKNQAKAGFAAQYPTLWSLGCFFEEIGASKMVDAGIKTVGVVSPLLP